MEIRAQKFHEFNGRYPVIWIDKACLDEQNIKLDLILLPMFITKSHKSLIILTFAWAKAAMACQLGREITLIGSTEVLQRSNLKFERLECSDDHDRIALMNRRMMSAKPTHHGENCTSTFVTSTCEFVYL